MPRRRKSFSDVPEDPEVRGGADEPERPSKSARKREMHELQQLGSALIDLNPQQLAAIPIGEPLRDAIELAQRIRSHEGLRRQRQLIGKLMRDVDADAVRAGLEAQTAHQRADTALAHAAEHWRTQLLEDPDAIAAFGRRFGASDSADRLRRLVSDARAERAGGGLRGAYRALYREVLKTMRLAREPSA